MQVARWGNSLAVRLPKKVVEELGLKAGDEISLVPAGPRQWAVERRDKAADFLAAAEKFRFHLPKGYRFDRDEANER